MNPTLRRSIAAAALLLVPVLSSCGFDRPTDRIYTAGVGVNERSGAVDVLHALVVSGADGSGTVIAGLVNNDPQNGDALTRIAGSGQDAALSVTMAGPVEIGAGGLTQLADESPIFVEGDAITAGSFVELTFSFQRGEDVTVEVPVVARRGDYAEISVPSVSPSATPETGSVDDHGTSDDHGSSPAGEETSTH